ncbi:type 3 dihydrofolate reductase [Buchnera aphidicola (Macrosiphoniella sanborni)]|uniref:Dihydrofolate reductase n=1 Tax=Buchnera aphidicola (Macrosiphoniella sanborni) TaxID=1241865 RepID=A0A4D6YCD5_9GAMM|nr:type 3 dihydrofolate reductase [Buchnera aphidicola]QCI23698.1 type 3 dihydrofolate reductase [Buchnera aphidicola (Macrosiphoniella sanborni)]
MNISLIAAISKNLIIGYQNKIPWYIPEDLKWFKKKTIYKNIIMGRMTWESILKPLPDRRNIVISKNKIEHTDIIWCNSITQAISNAISNVNMSKKYHQEIMVIGGAQIYKKMLFYANKLYLTHIDIEIIGDSYFPEYKLYPSWKVLFKQNNLTSKCNLYNYSFEILSR